MNGANKKSFFNKKNLLIIGICLVALFIMILFFISKDDKEEKVTINCSFKKELPIMEANISMKVDYVNDKFVYVKEEYTFKLLNEQLISKIDVFKQQFENRLAEVLKNYEKNYSVEKSNDSLIIKMEFDNETYEQCNEVSKSLVGDNSLNVSEYYYGSKSLEQFIKNKGGECYYE